MAILKCPVCGETIWIDNDSYVCKNRHSFDIAKEGYVNLLSGGHRPGDLIGDNKDMASLGYILFFIPLITCKDSKLGRYCANQGLLLLIANHPGLTHYTGWLMTGINANQQQGA